jgi:dihydrofolate reductase
MGKAFLAAVMSVDGYIADTEDDVGPLFDWYANGDVEFYGADPNRPFRTTQASADSIRPVWARIGATVIGRRLFDLTNGWNGVPAVGEHVFVVTHGAPTGWPFPDAPFTFVTDGVASAIAQAKAFAGEERDVVVTAGEIGGQAFGAGLVDEVDIALAPVVFGDFANGPVLLDNPQMVQGDRVTHLRYRVSGR